MTESDKNVALLMPVLVCVNPFSIGNLLIDSLPQGGEVYPPLAAPKATRSQGEGCF
jgi:hypothetical protein